MDQINHLQQSNQELHNELKKAKQHIQQLEEQIDIKVKQATNTTDTQPNQVPFLNTPPPQMVQAVISEIKEQDSQSWVKREIRVGGLGRMARSGSIGGRRNRERHLCSRTREPGEESAASNTIHCNWRTNYHNQRKACSA